MTSHRCYCKFIDFDFSKNMQCKSFTIRWDFDWRSKSNRWSERESTLFASTDFDFLTCDIHLFFLLLYALVLALSWRVAEQDERCERWIELLRERSIRCFDWVTNWMSIDSCFVQSWLISWRVTEIVVFVHDWVTINECQ